MKRNRSRRKGVKTSTKEKRKELKRLKYAAMRESARGEDNQSTITGRGRAFTHSQHYPAHKRRKERQLQAIERKKISDKLSPQERIAQLKDRPGESKKELTRLLERISINAKN